MMEFIVVVAICAASIYLLGPIGLVVGCVVSVIAGIFYIRWQRNAPPPETVSLSGPGTFEFDIVGESFYQKHLERICGGRTEEGANVLVEATIHLEDDNEYDPKAVRVEVLGDTVGHLSRDDARRYRKQWAKLGLDDDVVGVCKAVIVGGWKRKGSKGHFGVKLDLPVK